MNRQEVLDTLHHSLEGIRTTVIDHSDLGLVGRSGIILAESRYMLHLQDQSGVQFHVSKEPGIFRLFTPRGNVQIAGTLLEGDAKRRSKRKLRHW